MEKQKLRRAQGSQAGREGEGEKLSGYRRVTQRVSPPAGPTRGRREGEAECGIAVSLRFD